MSELIFDLAGVGFDYGKLTVIDGLDLQVKKGELVVCVGVDAVREVDGELRHLVARALADAGFQVVDRQEVPRPHPGTGHLDEVVGLVRPVVADAAGVQRAFDDVRPREVI